MQTSPNRPTASDVVLRSSDGKMFYSWKALLSISSPIFNDMFTIPQPDKDKDDECHWHDGLPVIDLAEDGCTLGNILSLCHPPSCTGKPFEINNAYELRDVLEATMKYDMEALRCVVLKGLENPSFLRKDPLRIYALACRHECAELARLAAKHTLTFPLSTLMQEEMPELEKIHAGWLWRLLRYREASAAAAYSLADDHTWIIISDFSSLFGYESNECGWTTVRQTPSRKYPAGRIDTVSVHTWWLEYMKKSRDALQRTPHGSVVKDKGLVNAVLSAITSSTCKTCKEYKVWETFQSFVDKFAEHVERRVAEVEICI